MSISLAKGQKISLKKEDGGVLTNVMVGLGWSVTASNAASYDLDATVFMQHTGKVPSIPNKPPVEKKGFLNKIFSKKPASYQEKSINQSKLVATVDYSRLNSWDNSIHHCGDNLTGGSGVTDDEQVNISLSKVSSNIDRLVVGVNIYNPGTKHFGNVSKAYVRVVDKSTGKEIARYNLANDFINKKAIIVGALERTSDGWEFLAIGKGSTARDIRTLGKEA